MGDRLRRHHGAFKPLWKHSIIIISRNEGLENPTSENMAIWIWERLKPNLPLLTPWKWPKPVLPAAFTGGCER
ncbi:MAG: hypothetical protein CM1200mP29_06100 [Verrucomicrobiota bacterium]|nr:MAG: hypothetical protein CM1200mP29_06100 [Verrucomicrobiota bacterium]